MRNMSKVRELKICNPLQSVENVTGEVVTKSD